MCNTLYKHIKTKLFVLKQIHNKTIWWVVLERKILDHILKSPNAFKTLYTRWRRQTSIDMYYTCFQNIMLHHLNTCPMKLHTKHSLNKTKNWSTTTQMETTRKWVSVGLIHSVNEMVQYQSYQCNELYFQTMPMKTENVIFFFFFSLNRTVNDMVHCSSFPDAVKFTFHSWCLNNQGPWIAGVYRTRCRPYIWPLFLAHMESLYCHWSGTIDLHV